MDVKYNTYHHSIMTDLRVNEDDYVVTLLVCDVIRIEPGSWNSGIAIEIPSGYDTNTVVKNGKTRILVSPTIKTRSEAK